MHYFYIIYSSRVDRYYVGETTDFETRLKQHKEGFFSKSYTSISDDWEMKLLLEFIDITSARKAELFVKRMNSRKFVENLIMDHAWFLVRFNQ